MKLNSFYIKLLVINILVFIIHLLLLSSLEYDLFSNKIIASYIINFSTAASLFLVSDKFKDNIGFIFMLSSFLKFGLFFIFINPTYKLDGVSTRVEFLTFFTPYVVNLIYESVALSKLLNNLDYSD